MEAQDLIYLVSCAVNGRKPDPERIAGMDMDELYEQANRHYLTAAVAHALETAGVKEERFVKAKKHSALKNAQMDMEMADVFAELDAAGIWHMPLKGTLLQHMYPVYGMRQMSDHDILFDAKRADDVKSIMEKLGFSVEHSGASNHDVYHKEPVSNFEMHTSLFGSSHDEKMYKYYTDVEKRLLGDGYEKHFSPEDFYIYMLAHEYTHYSVGGTGLRSILDVYVYLQKELLDMDYVATETEKLGIAEFETSNRSLAQHLFSGKELTDADKEMLEYVLSSGVYGTMDHRMENWMKEYGGGKIWYMLNRFFVPVSKKNKRYHAMAAHFPFFYKHKILLPLLPFYRVLLGLKNGNMIRELKILKQVKK
ncbi:MAG: nucleotidyltransferase family protein [Lachnospiraceae bacterium]|nr:nucleotidyltransferase family protein [Lachnospiraceae bacterium]